MTRAGRLLIVDDDPSVGLVLVFTAQAIGFDARLCASAEEFLAQCADWAPTHVAIDLTMPDLDGLPLLCELARRGCSASIVICSGADPATLQRAEAQCRALGLRTAGVLAKPFTLNGLRGVLGITPAVPASA